MKKPNWIGIPARDIDRIFADAIERIAEGDAEFSCCAISTLELHERDASVIRQFYTGVFAPRTGGNRPYLLLPRVTNHVGVRRTDKSQGFRILMLSLVKAAWRDLV